MTSKLDAIAARLEAATPGPWKPHRTGKWEHDNYVVREDLTGVAMQYALVWQPGDADLIAHAPADLAALLAVVREVAAANDRYMRGEISATALSIGIHAALAPLIEGEAGEKPCNCGFGGTHDPDNPRCVVNDPSEAWLNDAEENQNEGARVLGRDVLEAITDALEAKP